MVAFYCYNHSPEPVRMVFINSDDFSGGSFYSCPTCHHLIKFIPQENEVVASFADVTEEEARNFLEEYLRLYQLADIEQFMSLWADTATQSVLAEGNRQVRFDRELGAIRRSYDGAFRLMGHNRYNFQLIGLKQEDTNMRVIGSYHIEYRDSSNSPHVYDGSINILLSRHSTGKVQILHLAYQPTVFK